MRKIIRPLKTCQKCRKEQSTNNFNHNTITSDGFCRYCKNCEQGRINIRNVKTSKSRKSHLKNKYDLSTEDYNKLFDNQCGYCYICLTNQKDLNKRLAVDHCHKTGKIRALLCSNCNLALGQMKDSTFLLQRMIEYLNKFNGES